MKIETKSLIKKWGIVRVTGRDDKAERPNLEATAETVLGLCFEIDRLRGEIRKTYEAQKCRDQQNEVMLMEVSNIVNKYKNRLF